MDTTSFTSVQTKAYTFLGSTAKRLGRFGIIQPGQTIRLTAEEEKDIATDAEWAYAPDQTRTVVSAARTYYVAPSGGSDSNDGLTTSTPWATLSHAIDVIHAMDINASVNVTIQLMDGTHTLASQLTIRNYTGIGQVQIQGNTSDKTAVTLTAPAGSGAIALNFIGTGGCRWVVKSLTMVGTTASIGINLSSYARVTVDSLRFGANFASCFSVANSSFLQLIGSAYEFFGSVSNAVFLVQRQSQVLWATACTVTVTGTPSMVWVSCIDQGQCRISSASVTFSGSATGARYSGTTMSLIQTNGGGASYFPGNSSGSVDSSSVYA